MYAVHTVTHRPGVQQYLHSNTQARRLQYLHNGAVHNGINGRSQPNTVPVSTPRQNSTQVTDTRSGQYTGKARLPNSQGHVHSQQDRFAWVSHDTPANRSWARSNAARALH